MKPVTTKTLLHSRRIWLLACILLIGSILAHPQYAAAEGSRSLYPANQDGARANTEWRNSTYIAGRVFRRTLLKVYANQGEYILLGSSAIATPGPLNNGDIRVYNPNLVTGRIGEEIIPSNPSFSCRAQRAATNRADQGRIASRVQELAGPDTIVNRNTAQPGGVVANGYVPCFYRAPANGVYDIVFLGPRGDNSNDQTTVTGQIGDNPDNFNSSQDTSVAVWDVTVRTSLDSTQDIAGRLFTYYLTLFTGDNARPINSTVYLVSTDGFQYAVDLRGMDPNGFVLYGNKFGFLDSDGESPLYRNVLAKPNIDKQDQNQLLKLQGDVTIAPPEFPIFFSKPSNQALEAINVPTQPDIPVVNNFRFRGALRDNITDEGLGGTFEFDSSTGGVVQIVISRDGQNFDPTLSTNRRLTRVREAGTRLSIDWDGRDNNGNVFPAPAEGQPPYMARITVRGGEFHFPFIDVENSVGGGPSIKLINPPDGVCPLWGDERSCTRAFYDDRGYLTANGELVGTAVNGPLCPNNAGRPPNPLFSDPIIGFDSTTNQRSFGFRSGGNPPNVCDPEGGFGDKKGLDIWTYYPSAVVETSIAFPTLITLQRFTALHQGNHVDISWETTTEANTWGFHLLRSSDRRFENAVRVTGQLIPAQGNNGSGGRYRWRDAQSVQSDVVYTYWLQEVELNGNTHLYGPFNAGVASSVTFQTFFLPAVLR